MVLALQKYTVSWNKVLTITLLSRNVIALLRSCVDYGEHSWNNSIVMCPRLSYLCCKEILQFTLYFIFGTIIFGYQKNFSATFRTCRSMQYVTFYLSYCLFLLNYPCHPFSAFLVCIKMLMF